ncbi:glycosyltransferase family 2 protein [Anaerotruncus rubiinfantis]|uniref:glycosyltransferase family 2 protein n=1 Tax=Anaerotruncus rubiinfantis TaxID=1720200 RepID=UPI00082CD74A|nr:glycosyltransferase family 2 protein [Anaerotruncus rubiinfantis]
MERVLTIAVPSYNMEKHLPKNLPSYADERLAGKVQVIVLDNASEDETASIAQGFVDRYPEIFTLLRRDSRGYGGSINAAMALARGKYFRIVDADDWVDTEELVRFVEKLRDCGADVVQTNYRRVVMGSGEELPFRFSGVEYEKVYTGFSPCRENAPCIHSTTYRTELLRESGFQMQDGIFFVDEEYVILPFLSAKSVVYYDLDIYRYLVGNPAQSTSPENRAKYAAHRAQIVRRLLEVYGTAKMSPDVRNYCFFRIAQAAADHLTTLYIYLPDRMAGRKAGMSWETYVRGKNPEIYAAIRKKGFLLRQLNRLHVGLSGYEKLKRILLGR